jgi:glyceraldehyde 3-phosphate dehydrogenase
VEADAKGGAIVVDGRRIAFSAERDPTKIRWADARATHVVECSGVFVDGAAAAGHLTGGARKVIMSAPAKDDATFMLLMGVNHESYDPKARARRMRCACVCARIRAAEGALRVRCASRRACTWSQTRPAPPTAWRRSPRRVALRCMGSARSVRALGVTRDAMRSWLQVVDDSFGIEEGLMTTVHAVTASQKVVDAPGGKKDWRAGRSALDNIIPAT